MTRSRRRARCVVAALALIVLPACSVGVADRSVAARGSEPGVAWPDEAGGPGPIDVPPTSAPRPRSSMPPSVALPDPAKVDAADASAVAVAVGVTLKSADAGADQSWHDAALRASAYLTPELVAIMSAGRPRVGAADAWETLAGHDARTTATATVLSPEAGQPADTLAEAYRTVAVTVSARGIDGWQAPPVVVTIHMRLNRATLVEPWKVAMFDEYDPPSPEDG